MGAAPRRVSEADYLAAERESETKHEYDDGVVYAMSGASYVHNVITSNLTRHLGNALAGKPCKALAADLRVGMSRAYFYPDIVVHCGPPEFLDDTFDTLLNPTVVIEVLSDSTERNDRGPKFRRYETIPTLREYVLVSQDEPRIERFERASEGAWMRTVVAAGAELPLKSLSIAIPVDAIYDGVPFPARD